MMKPILFTISTLLFASTVFGQTPTFSVSSGSYAHLTGATRVVPDSVWDDPTDWTTQAQTINTGFTFKAFGKSITAFQWEQGGIYFRDIDTVWYFGLQDVDMCDYGFGTKNPKSPIWMKKEGSSGSYIMKLEWENFGFWDDWNKNGTGSCKDSGNVQLWIYESAQKMELRFGNSKLASFSTLFPDGLRTTCAKYDVDGRTSGILLDGSASNPTAYDFSDTGTRTIKGWPTAGTIYTFNFGPTNGLKTPVAVHQLYYANGIIQVSGATSATSVELFTADGRFLRSQNIDNGFLDVSDLGAGVYLARVYGSGNHDFLRFIKSE